MTNPKHIFTIIFSLHPCPPPQPPSWLIGGLQTPQSPGKVEKVCLPLLWNSPALSPEVFLWNSSDQSCCFASASLVGGLFQERLWAPGHSGGGLAGVTGGDAPSLHPVLRVAETMQRLLRRWSPGVCSLAHAHAHHGGTCSDAHSIPVVFRAESWIMLTRVVVCAADANLLHEAWAGGAAVRGAQPVWVQVNQLRVDVWTL